MVRVGLWGTFDVEHLGEALFARLLGTELARRVAGLQLVPASPLGYVGLNRYELDEPAAPLGAWSEERVAELAADLDALVIVGEVVHGDDARLAPWYGLPPEELIRRAPGRFLVEGLGKHEVDVPVVWWGIGVGDADVADVAPELAERWRRAAAGRAAVAVRDGPSRAALLAAGVTGRLDVVPDMTLAAPRAFPPDVSEVRIDHLRRRGAFPDGDALVVQGGAASLPHVDAIAAQVREICAARRLTPVIVETEPVHGDVAFAGSMADALPEALRMPSDAGVEDLVAAVAWSAGAVGDSRALAVLAAAFGRGGAIVDVDGRPSRADVAERLGLGARLVGDPGEIAAAFETSAERGSVAAAVEAARDELDVQLDRLGAILTPAEVRPHEPPPVEEGSTLADERERYALASRALVARMAATQRAFALREAELRAYGDAIHRELVERDIRFTKLWRRLHEADRHYHFHIHRADEAEARIEHLEREIEFLRGQRVRPWARRRFALFLWWLRPTPVGRALAAARARLRERP